MPISSRAKSKSRMITFRLTLDEYERAREVCYTRGLSSVSDMARTAINLLIQQPERVEPQALETRVSDLESRLHILLLDFKRLTSPESRNAQ